ncbi:MAG TPA: glycosyltransferase [Candidatus Saccharimonadales bacterium]|nr:glycosyltransferase [Candidatus Saccharimonadales bacterium]
MNRELGKLNVAIVCDWLTSIGGAERVVFALHQMFPTAPIYTSQYNPKAINWSSNADVRMSGFLQRLPVVLRKFLPAFRAWYFSHLDLSSYDLVISSSGAEAKSVRTGPLTIHVCYCHAPTHYYWMRYESYIKNPGFQKFDWLAKFGLRLLVKPMRRWDKKVAQRPDYMIANSSFTRSEIKKYYGRDSVIIHPPIDIDRFSPKVEKKRFGFLVVGRQTPYKRIDLAVLACTQLNLPLTVVGDGPENHALHNLAGPTVKFVSGADDERVAEHMQSAEALIFPTDREDFGITPVEALAAGTPVIAYGGGGVLDYLVDGKTGSLFQDLSVASLANCLETFNPGLFKVQDLKDTAAKFSAQKFEKRMSDFVNNVISKT